MTRRRADPAPLPGPGLPRPEPLYRRTVDAFAPSALPNTTEGTVSARTSLALEREVERLTPEERLEKSAALRRLLHLGGENHRLDPTLRGLREGRFSLPKAAGRG